MLSDYSWGKFWESMSVRWPEWNPGNITMTDWREAFAKYDVFILGKAVTQYLIEHTKFKSPDLSKLHKIVKRLSAMQISQRNYEPGAKLVEMAWICCGKDDDERGQIGRMMQFNTMSNKLPGVYETTRRSEDYSKEFGGRWLYITGNREIRSKRLEILHESGLCHSSCPHCNSDRAAKFTNVTSLNELAKAISGPLSDLNVGAPLNTLKERSSTTEPHSQSREQPRPQRNPNRLFDQDPDGSIPF